MAARKITTPMKWTLNRKFALILFLASLTLVGGIAIATHLSFKNGLLHYLNKTEEKRVDALTAVLADFHERMKGWDTIRHDPFQWHQIMRAAHHFYGMSPPHEDDQDARTLHRPDRGQPEKHSLLAKPPKPPKPDLLSMAARYTLIDADGDFLAGAHQPAPDAVRYQIKADNQIIGYLLVQPLHVISDKLDKAFVRHQRETLTYIVICAALLALVIANFLARHLLTPILRLAEATRALASGNYQTRITVASQDELGDLTQDFNHLASALESNEQLRRHWMADISHELRTPVTVLKGEIEALQDGVRPLTPKSIQSLHQEAELLAKLIEDLYQLSLSDLGALTYHMQALEPLALLIAVIEIHRKSFLDKGITIETPSDSIPPNAVVWGDSTRLQQLFHNLLINSLRYTDAPGTLKIDWQMTDSHLCITVNDSAPGVVIDALPQLFTRLYRVETSRNRAQGGAGLGLAICKNIVEAHHGSISAHPSSLGGLCIDIRLPLCRTPPV